MASSSRLPQNSRPQPPPLPAPRKIQVQNKAIISYIDVEPARYDAESTPTIVLVHGSPGNYKDFRYIVPLLQQSVRVVALNLPGFDDSEVIDTANRFEHVTAVGIAEIAYEALAEICRNAKQVIMNQEQQQKQLEDEDALASAVSLTADGARVLRGELPRGSSTGDAGVLLQVLSVTRHLVDPALRRLLAGAGGPARDAFDVVLSDGRLKTKCLLAPALNAAVWRGQVAPLDVIWVSEFQVLRTESGRPVCLVTDFESVAQQNAKFFVTAPALPPPEKRRAAQQLQVQKDDGDDLAFVSSASERDTGLLPVAGERAYYLPLDSDQFPLEWEATGPPTSARRLCASPFAASRRIRSIREIHDLLAGADAVRCPPLVGVVRVKSKVTHFGEPGVANPFPFMFHIIVGDSDAVAEVAFFGSMCAKYFGAIDEGDLVQLCGYSAKADPASSASDSLLFFEHESVGEVCHVSEKHWKLLQTLRLVPEPVGASDSSDSDATAPIWFERSFGSTLDAQYAREQVGDRNVSAAFFDFVGVLSFVGKICRKRKRAAADEAGGAVTQYRWLKAVDRSSSVEMAILLHDCSHPQQFRSLKAGDFVVLTRLKWVVERDPATFLSSHQVTAVDDHIFGAQYAACSAFSALRVNDATAAFDGVEDCSLSKFFATKLVANSTVREHEAADESWLEGETIAQYHALPNVVGDSALSSTDFLGRKTHPYSELLTIVQSLETMEHRHIGVTARLTLIPKAPSKEDRHSPLAYEIEFGDADRSRRATLHLNPVFHTLTDSTAARNRIKNAAPGAFDGLFSTLAPSIVDELVAAATKRAENREPRLAIASSGGHRQPKSLTRAFIEQHLVKSQREFVFSTHLYRTPQGRVTVEVDAILPLAAASTL